MNIDPRDVPVIEWCAQTALVLSKFTTVPRLLDPNGWKFWALNVIQSPKVAAFFPPDPSYFTDWRDWAVRFNQMVPL
jgi:hypothetical protein